MTEFFTDTTFRSGFVALLGRPNVGKSTLLNRLTGEKIAITTPKPQTTRDRILGVVHRPGAQIAFIDTPGFHRARKRLNQYMVRQATSAIEDVDVVVIMVDASDSRDEFEDRWGAAVLAQRAGESGKPVIVALNKVDLVHPKDRLLPLMARWGELEGVKAVVPVSAAQGDGTDLLVDEIVKLLPEGPAYYPEDMVTDRPDTWIAAEMIREQVMLRLREEIPYSTAVVIEEFRRSPKGVTIRAVIYVERTSQKGIVIGARGSMIKTIGSAAREVLSGYFGGPVHLFLDVKVKKDWSSKVSGIRHMGYEE